MSSRMLPDENHVYQICARPTVTGQRRIVVFQINCGTISQQRRPPYHAMHSEEFQSVRDRPV